MIKVPLPLLTHKIMLIERGRGASQKKFLHLYTGRLHPEVQTLTLKYTHVYQIGAPFIIIPRAKLHPFLIPQG